MGGVKVLGFDIHVHRFRFSALEESLITTRLPCAQRENASQGQQTGSLFRDLPSERTDVEPFGLFEITYAQPYNYASDLDRLKALRKSLSRGAYLLPDFKYNVWPDAVVQSATTRSVFPLASGCRVMW